MRITIIKSDNMVYVDGAPLPIDCSALPVNVHAVQWFDTWGDVELVDGAGNHVANERITDIAPYQPFVDAWTAASAAIQAAAAAAAQAAVAASHPAKAGTVNVIASS